MKQGLKSVETSREIQNVDFTDGDINFRDKQYQWDIQGMQCLALKNLNSNSAFRRQRVQVHKNLILQVLLQQIFLAGKYRVLYILFFTPYL